MIVRVLLLSLIVFFSIASTVAAQQGVELCVALDGSLSMSSADFNLQKQGLASAIQDSSIVPRNGTVAIAVVQFSTTAQLEVTRTVIDSESTATTVANNILAITKMNGYTAIGEGIALCEDQFIYPSEWKQVINISTDGTNTSGQNPVTAADNAVAAGVDAINAIGVGTGINVAELNSIVRPQPANAMGQGDGFVVVVSDFNEYASTIKEKIKTEIGNGKVTTVVPTMTEWGMIIFVFLAGSGAIYFLRRQRRA